MVLSAKGVNIDITAVPCQVLLCAVQLLPYRLGLALISDCSR